MARHAMLRRAELFISLSTKDEHQMAKVRKQTPGQAYVERIDRLRREAEANRKAFNLDMLPEERAAIEQQIGRPLTSREIIMGELNRVDDAPVMERIANANWKPVMPKQEGLPFADAVAAAEEEVRREQFAKLSPAEKQLFMMKEAQLKKLQEQQSAAEHKARLADPRVAGKLSELRALQRATAFDPSWRLSDREAIDRAITQLETVGANLQEGFRLAEMAIGIDTDKRETLADAKQQAIAKLQGELAELGIDVEINTSDGTSAAVDDSQAENVDPREAAFRAKDWDTLSFADRWKRTQDYIALGKEREAAASQQEPPAAE
jgi:hypothetical protein